jgi:NADPH:quinone reductase-like Zn-dependent oxidoreductase
LKEVSTPAPIRPGTMKAWHYDRYGPPEVLRLQDVPFPSFRDDHEVLVRVLAASVNPADRHNLKMPFLFRRGRGFLRPKDGRLGLDFAGRVEAAGSGVKDLHIGDEIFGVATGAFGEYAVADVGEVALKPAGLTKEQAAAVPIAAVTALQGLRDKAEVRSGMRVLVNGASGGVGTFAVQIARALGAEVSAVCSTRNVELIKSLGVARVFDYSREDFAQSGERYDVIFDTQLNRSLSDYRRALKKGGLLLMVGGGSGSVGRTLGRLLKISLASRLVGLRTRFYIASVKRADLDQLRTLLESGKATPVIDRQFPLAQLPNAISYLIEGHARGKIVIAM